MTITRCTSYAVGSGEQCQAVAVAVTSAGRATCAQHRYNFHANPRTPKLRHCRRCKRDENETHIGYYMQLCGDCQPAAKQDYRCGLCRRSGHRTFDCPLKAGTRESDKVCWLCGSLSHRVAGLKCARCGRRRGSEPALRIDDYASARCGVDPRGL